jgi:hypothetical protein
VEDQDHDQPETLPKYDAEENASEDDVPQDHVNADKIDVPNDVDGDHTHPDEGVFPRLQRRGTFRSHWMKKCPRKYLRQ